MIKIRDVCNLSIEQKRANKEIGSSLEAALLVKLNSENQKILNGIDLSELCITSSVKIQNSNEEEIIVETTKASGKKCSICWKIRNSPCERPHYK